MSRKCRRLVLVMAIMIIIAPLSTVMAGNRGMPPVKVMTRNLYLGADIFKVATAPAEQIPFVVREVYETMLYTNFWARAEAIADEIADNRPDIIGLQEVSTYYKQTPGDSLTPSPTPATDLVIDYLTVLNDALEARGLYYDAYITTNSEVEVPMYDPDAGPSYLSDVRLVDHDVILVKSTYESRRVVLDEPYETSNFQNNLQINIGGIDVTFTRGFVIVDVDIHDTTFRCINTHLEVSGDVGSVFRVYQAAQMQELLAISEQLASVDPRPVILLGDLNSSPRDVPGMYVPEGSGPEEGIVYVPPYIQAGAAEFMDTWLLQGKCCKASCDEGYTDGFDETIDNPDDTLEARIDHVFLAPDNLVLKKVRSRVVGVDPAEMVENLPYHANHYLWPSDHGGVVAKLKFKRHRNMR